MSAIAISEAEFAQFQRFIHEMAGISLSATKKQLVSGRLSARLRQHQLGSFAEYFQLLRSGTVPGEMQAAVDLLTTNETYFFREPRHFDFLRQLLGAAGSAPWRVWSAASSSGEEAYSIAMVLAELARGDWQVVGSDISERVLARAARGQYPLDRARNIPDAYLRRFCLRGVDDQQGTLLVSRELRSRVQFLKLNLNAALPAIGPFDLVFLRNVMIYFDAATKRQVVERVLGQLRPGGHLFVGHAESLHGVSQSVQMVAPSIYRKP